MAFSNNRPFLRNLKVSEYTSDHTPQHAAKCFYCQVSSDQPGRQKQTFVTVWPRHRICPDCWQHLQFSTSDCKSCHTKWMKSHILGALCPPCRGEEKWASLTRRDILKGLRMVRSPRRKRKGLQTIQSEPYEGVKGDEDSDLFPK